jgi:hypothetical protein
VIDQVGRLAEQRGVVLRHRGGKRRGQASSGKTGTGIIRKDGDRHHPGEKGKKDGDRHHPGEKRRGRHHPARVIGSTKGSGSSTSTQRQGQASSRGNAGKTGTGIIPGKKTGQASSRTSNWQYERIWQFNFSQEASFRRARSLPA